MQKEIIIHNNRKVTKTTKNNGTISYTQRGVYLGIELCFYILFYLYCRGWGNGFVGRALVSCA